MIEQRVELLLVLFYSFGSVQSLHLYQIFGVDGRLEAHVDVIDEVCR